MASFFLVPLTMILLNAGCSQPTKVETKNTETTMTTMKPENLDTATFGAGCFWCVEAIFLEMKGVVSVTSGYTGGEVKNPTYKEVCSGTTGHAEVTQVIYDPSQSSFKDMLEVFWQIHDPTTLNKQGADVGTQYRSAVFYHNDRQREEAEYFKQKLIEEKAYDKPIITEITPLKEFYKAEDYHQNYYGQNGEQTYCVYVIRPKLDKFRKAFKHKLK